MFLNPEELRNDPARLEEIEKASLRLVVQAIYEYRAIAEETFREETDLVADIGEDLTREALDKLGMSKIDRRIFGKVDYKRARYVFHPEYSVKQSLFIDSKAEKISGQGTATLQTSQFSMSVRQIRFNQNLEVAGKLPAILNLKNESFITTTLFVKYNYQEVEERNLLRSIIVAALPNGILQEIYNPNVEDTIFIAGRNAPTLGEEFRVRLSFARLKSKASWRVQQIPMSPDDFTWDD